jgi:hypothetical protein
MLLVDWRDRLGATTVMHRRGPVRHYDAGKVVNASVRCVYGRYSERRPDVWAEASDHAWGGTARLAR